MSVYKILVLLPHVSLSTVIINFKTNHLNQPGNVINPPSQDSGQTHRYDVRGQGRGEDKIERKRKNHKMGKEKEKERRLDEQKPQK